MRKRFSAVTTIVVLFGLLAGYTLMSACSLEKGKTSISKAVAEQLREGESLCLKARKLNTRDWERLWVIGPYVFPNDLSRFSWKVRWAVKRTGIRTTDDISVLLFLVTEGEYEIFVERRSPVDFVSGRPTTSIHIYSPEDILCFSKSDGPHIDFVLTAPEQSQGNSGMD